MHPIISTTRSVLLGAGAAAMFAAAAHAQLEFTKNSDGTVNGKLIGTNFGKIDKPLRNFKIDGRKMSFTPPNIQPWRFAGEVSEDGTIVGVVSSAQGGLPVTFRRASSSTE